VARAAGGVREDHGLTGLAAAGPAWAERVPRARHRHRRAADPTPDHAHADSRHQGRFASLRDDLRPPL